MPWLQLAAIVVGGMIGAGIFSLPRTFANATGPMGAVIAWLIAGTGMYMLARVFQALAERKPEIDTGVYAYAREGFGDSPGFVSVTCVMVLVTLLPYAVLANTRFKGGDRVLPVGARFGTPAVRRQARPGGGAARPAPHPGADL